jgi:hypothetical protein
MWRWVTRGLVLSLLLTAFGPALLAQLPGGFVGVVDTPDPTRDQSGVVLVKGWAYDPLTISRIELYIDDEFQHTVVKELPYLDIEQAYPQWPGLHTAKVGFQTGFLASRFENGTHTLFIRATLGDGRIEEFGQRTITINNTNNQSPFGSLDQPDAKGVYNASGAFPMVGWAADADGIARIEVQIDGGTMQGAMYGDARPDVAAAFPDFPAALFSGFIANVDTTRVQDGVHTMSVTAVDRNGASRLIGRRTVQILNSANNLKPFGYIDEPKRDAVLFGTLCGTGDGPPPPVISPPVRPQAHITPVRGWALDLGPRLAEGRVAYAELMIDGVRYLSTDDCTLPFGGYANCYGVPRYDVQRFFPNFPDAPRAGFIFTLDVGQLIGSGLVREGNHNLKVRVGDLEQTFTELPNPSGIPVFFECSENTLDSPSVGFIDVPTTFDYVGGDLVIQGWALDTDNVSVVEIIIDGNYVGQAQYGFPRPDVRDQWPNYSTAGFSGWRFTMDTTKLANSRHRVTARVLDGSGNRNEIGSVDFYVYNLAPTPQQSRKLLR